MLRMVSLAHLSCRLCVWLCVWLCVCLSVNIFKLEYLRNLWANRNEILPEPSLGWVAALGFGPDRIGTLVSQATDSSHRVIIGKML